MATLTARVTDSQGNQATATAELAVSSPPPGGVVPFFEEDFSTYGSVSGNPTRDFRDNINGWWGRWNGRFTEDAFIMDPNEIPPIGGATQSAKFTQVGSTQCKPGVQAGRRLFLPTPFPTEMWVEMYVKFSANYKTDYTSPSECGNVGNPDHKFIFFGRLNGSDSSTWRFKVGVSGRAYKLKGAGNNYSTRVVGDLPNSCFNDQWQRWRFRLRSASAPGVPDGHAEWRRVDLNDPTIILTADCHTGKLYHIDAQAPENEQTPFDSHDGFDDLDIGGTFNVGPTVAQSYWLGAIRIWDGDPGWGW